MKRTLLSFTLPMLFGLAEPAQAQGVPDSPKKTEALSEIRKAGYALQQAEIYLTYLLQVRLLDPQVEGSLSVVNFNFGVIWESYAQAVAILEGLAPQEPSLPATAGGFDIVTQPIEASCFLLIRTSGNFNSATREIAIIAGLDPPLPAVTRLNVPNTPRQNLRFLLHYTSLSWRHANLAARAIFEIGLE